MDKSKVYTATVLVASLSIPTIANSALVGRLAATEGGTDYQAYYDDVADLTWLADANYAVTSGYAEIYANGDSHSTTTNIRAYGAMGWDAAISWVAGLDIESVNGWRLPDTLQPDVGCDYQSGSGVSYGMNCTGSEMGNMFYNVLGGSERTTISRSHNSNYDLFTNVQNSYYWSKTELTTNTNYAWSFNSTGYQDPFFSKTRSFYAWAVHDGDVAVSAVPIPPSVFLFGSGLIGLIGLAKRKSNV